MEHQVHALNELFAQLGLPNTNREIETFIARHRLDHAEKLHEAGFWSTSQAELIRQMWLDDADWSGVIDTLDSRLHQ